MSTVSVRNNKQKRRPAGFQLTEEEIHNFIAHNGDGEDGSESDWDELGETDFSEFLSGVDGSTKCGNLPTEARTTLSQATEPTKPVGPRDVGLDVLFGNSTTTSAPSQVLPETDVNAFLSASDESDDEPQGLERADDDDNDVSLNECGSSIQKSLTLARRSEKAREIERAVNQSIRDMATTSQSSVPTERASVTTALAACAARRKKALDDLNNAQWPSLKTSNGAEQLSVRSTALVPHTNSQSSTDPTQSNLPDCWIATPTRLRVYRSRISSELWTQRTADREVLSLGQFMQKQRTNSFIGAPSTKRSRQTETQVLVGVIGNKSAPRRSRNDRVYSVWGLSDLDQIGPGASQGCVKLFLFGNSHEKLWKEAEGSVIAVLGPRIMSDPATSVSEKDISITLESPLHVMLLGQSPDFAICAASSKSGQPCFHVVNKSVCRYCEFHVKKAYFEASTSRPGFATTGLPVFSKRPGRRRASDIHGSNEAAYQYSLPTPQFFMMDSERRPSAPNPVKLSVSKLSDAGYHIDSAAGLGAPVSKTSTSTTSVPPSPTSNLSEPDTNKKTKSHPVLSSPERKLVAALRRPSAGSLNLLRHLELDEDSTHAASVEPKKSTSHSISNRIKPLQTSPTKKIPPAATFSQFFASVPKPSVDSKGTKLPCLPKCDGFIDLGPISHNTTHNICLAAARLRATALVQSRGGVRAMELEAKQKRKHTKIDSLPKPLVTGSSNRPSPLSQILGTTSGKTPAASRTVTHPSPAQDSEAGDGIENQPPVSRAKKSRAESLAALARQVRQGSAHVDLISEAEANTEQARLAVLEKRDEFQEKLASQTEEPCTYVHCKTCDYRAWKAAPDCRRSDHQLVYIKGTKRYFRCRNCGQRTVTFERYPTHCCKNCGESLFEKTGIVAERKGPSIPGEKLLPRGLEEKFL